jgi:hypothetical protein
VAVRVLQPGSTAFALAVLSNMLSLFWFSFVQADYFPPNAPHGASGCPCISDALLHSPEATCLYNGTNTGIINAKGDCFPSNYGIGSCIPWDENLPSCKSEGVVGGESDYCDKPWCYIDVTNCDRPHQTGLYFAASSYSFATCGYKDTFAPEISREDIFVQQHLNGKTLRVTFPGDWLWSLWTEPNGDRGGLYPSIISKVFREYAVNWKVQPLSNSSKAFSPDSTYHACVHDVAIGETDMCFGEFWPTVSRILLMEEQGAFAPSLFPQDDFYLGE